MTSQTEGPAPNEPVRIWFQKHAVAGRLPVLDASYERHLTRVANPGTAVTVETLPAATYTDRLPADYVRFAQGEALFAAYFAGRAVVAERKGYDAYIIGTSQDPGLDAARSLVSIPVLGYGECAFTFAGLRRLRFGVIGFIPELQELVEANLDRYGLRHWYAGSRYLSGGREVVESALGGAPGPFLAEMNQAAADLARLGAHIIIPGEGVPNEILDVNRISKVGGLRVLDANGLVVKMAELMVAVQRTGIMSTPTMGYEQRTMEAEDLDHFLRLFAPSALAQELFPDSSP